MHLQMNWPKKLLRSERSLEQRSRHQATGNDLRKRNENEKQLKIMAHVIAENSDCVGTVDLEIVRPESHLNFKQQSCLLFCDSTLRVLSEFMGRLQV